MALAAVLVFFLSGAAAAAPDIHAAIRAGDAAAVPAAIENPAELNRPDDWGRTPLIAAAQRADSFSELTDRVLRR